VPNLPRKTLEGFLSNSDNWKSLWLVSITLSILKHYDTYEDINHSIKKKELLDIINDKELLSPCSYMMNMIRKSTSALSEAENLYSTLLYHKMQKIRNQTAIFIDNVDEFFESELSKSKNDKNTRHLYKELWDSSQVGLLLAIRDINLINPHIKIFASVRQEVIPDLSRRTALAIQIEGNLIDLSYSDRELEEIIDKNIDNESPSRLFSNSRSIPPIQRFFGEKCSYFVHPTTGDEEDLHQYFLRHTLRRPRDIAHIGDKIATIPPAERTPRRIRDTINREGGRLINAYFREMEPHLNNFDVDKIIRLIPKNVLSKNEIKYISKQYDDIIGSNNESSHIFCNLYKIGVLGWVDVDIENNQPIQRFAKIGTVSLSKDNCLPDSEFYLIHPMLDDEIRLSNQRYGENMHKLNIIGDTYPWRDKRDGYFIARGDIKGFSGIMNDADMYAKFNSIYNSKVKEIVGKNKYSIEGGDSIMIVSENPKSLIDCCLMLDVMIRDEFLKNFRFAIDYGYMQFQNESYSGGVLRRAARIESAVKNEGIYITKDAISRIYELKMLNYKYRRLTGLDLTHLHFNDGFFNVSKGSGDEDTWVELFTIDE
jgi:hypothetical protein